MSKQTEIAVFGGGCFWCTEAVFSQLRGVESVMPGYAGGNIQDPSYQQVSSGTSGHAEVIRVEFNPEQISYRELLTAFFASHDSTTLNRQGNDIGTQYRSVILYRSEQQKKEAEEVIAEIDDDSSPVVTEVKPLDEFYEAEEEHKQFYARNPSQAYCQVVINPKLQKFQKEYAQLLKS
ncbi:MAG: peptide-methionine (S)-S-oxide reductase MsrA [Candidatus Andersenbacteria bacterium]